MSKTPGPPRFYQPGPIARIADGLRYGGGFGQWSWLIHRMTGVGILVFLIIHVLDTFFVVVAPSWYDHTVAIYGGIWFNGEYYAALRWGFRFAELGLIASVVFHAVNGVGVILYDFWNKGTANRKGILKGVQIVFWTIMIPTTFLVLYPLSQPPGHLADTAHSAPPSEASNNRIAPAPQIAVAEPSIARAPRSITLLTGMMGAGVAWICVLGLVPPAGTRVRPSSGLELRAWYLMRISGLLLVFLAVGHLFIMHILNNVETINYAFIANRWAAPKSGAIWRMWDFAMITLAVGHGFNGLRQILYEYIAKPSLRMLVSTLIWLATVSLIAIGSYAIFMFQADTDYIKDHPLKTHTAAESTPNPQVVKAS